jgi:hypothetical protein
MQANGNQYAPIYTATKHPNELKNPGALKSKKLFAKNMPGN